METKTDQWPSENRASAWIEMGKATSLPGSSLYQAIFAAKVYPRPYEERWSLLQGFTVASLIEEAFQRQRELIAGLHPADDMTTPEPLNGLTLALLCRFDPAFPGCLTVLLVVKVCAATPAVARAAAMEYAFTLPFRFPPDYAVDLITTQDAFYANLGWSLLEEINQPGEVVELRRFIRLLDTSLNYICPLGEWCATPTANEQIWRALVAAARPIFFRVTLRPTILEKEEREAMDEMITAAQLAATNTTLLSIKMAAEATAESYRTHLSRWRYPFLIQLHLVAPGGVPSYLPQVIGAALTSQSGADGRSPGYEVIRLKELDLDLWQKHWRWLELDLQHTGIADRRLARQPYLASDHEAQILFRFPFPLKLGIPGVSFRH